MKASTFQWRLPKKLYVVFAYGEPIAFSTRQAAKEYGVAEPDEEGKALKVHAYTLTEGGKK